MQSITFPIYYKENFEHRWLPGDQYLRAIIRKLIRGKPVMGGIKKVYVNLAKGLDLKNINYLLNPSWKLAEKHGVAGIIGKSNVLEDCPDSIPIVAGPGIYTHPAEWDKLIKHKNIKSILLPSQWAANLFRKYYGDLVKIWPVGIDTDFWSDTRRSSKDIDFLIYEKILWDRDIKLNRIIKHIIEELDKRNLSYQILHCGTYTEMEYHSLLEKSKYMVFLCEHESQGIAYQEALSRNVPVLALDPGYWADPVYGSKDIMATSVPYFSNQCGVRFENVNLFSTRLSELLAGKWEPREYIKSNLGLEKCAMQYINLLEAAKVS